MNQLNSQPNAGISRLRNIRRKPVASSNEVTKGQIDGHTLPLVYKSENSSLSLSDWINKNKVQLETELLQHGALLFRGFSIEGEKGFENLIQSISDKPMLEYTNRSTPRSSVRGNVYTSTEYPADQEIALHNENAYTTSWPSTLYFYSHTAAEQGGSTHIGDSRKVFQQIDPAIRKRFAEKGVRYVRNYGELDLPWEEVFQTTDKLNVESQCKERDINIEWLNNGERLRTWQNCQGVAQHPVTKEDVWFNQAHLFHVSNLPQEIKESLQLIYAEEELPRHAFYGDGSSLEESVLEEIRGIYKENEVVFPWQQNDLMIVDNMLAVHGRKPFKGKRRILVGMT
ncbi:MULTISPECIES: TauD/TfdA family dioxygenase [unclassified Colwellia]|uniref:TauD/TfdA family dioxygenase n=1 Tax=unclassified Colwellia TaxID=196834 RepID=UPI0015F5C492|nr:MULTISPECIES: TauD/TfdA family dioxygenase [unclassified Colwellia]MBA6257670.1 TauD/TfdA family dioxygenase [Colwellia sp. MB3u-28]MBA6259427.1 TauD/TfdA family dioxygenase [Colwellia sp. MB3u-41]